ncbi:DsbA family protein [Methylobacterium sp. J-059]|uniref:thioredoxin domain-containing protein n=1 Tax=Methylobacterium sp. J-059 TaxID=2836643 RepID=UPI001FB94BDC|nr:thioredoxin domain-containing protein [Methylobacterium sp. J-059]MCJ2039120.1 DsbA family protein [Methylobacterium sp. J-059]
MTSVAQTAPVRLTRRGALARFAVGLASSASPRTASAASVADASLAGPLGDVWVGSPQAKVTLVEYAAVTCPHCARFHAETWPALKARWIDAGQVRFTLRGYPLNPLDTAGFMLARADDGRNYYAVTDLLFERQPAWAFVPKPLDAMRDLMRQAGFSAERFDSTLSDQGLYDGVRIVHERATSALGVRSTPTVYVGEERQEGTLTADALGEVIARALEGRTGR